MRKHIQLLVWIVGWFGPLGCLSAQQLPQYTQFSINPYLVNPAVAGTEDFVHLQAGYRSQWSGFAEAPKTGFFSAHSPLTISSFGQTHNKFTRQSWTSVGLRLYYDETGPLSQKAAAATFAYNIVITEDGLRLSFGLQAGLKQFGYDPTGFVDELADLDDPTIQQVINEQLIDFSAGFWLYNDRFFLGASSDQLIEQALRPGTSLIGEQDLVRHYYAMAGYKWMLDQTTYLVPAILVKYVATAPISFDINAKLVMQDRFWLGGSYRHEDSFALFGGLLITDRLELSYAYDVLLSPLRQAAAGSHEILIGYRLFHRQQVVCPSRFW